MCFSSIQFADGPVGALPDGGIQIRDLPEILEPLCGVRVLPFK
jgi:hypothetical protein